MIKRYKHDRRGVKVPSRLRLLILVLVVIVLGALVYFQLTYTSDLKPLDASDTTVQSITINSGSTLNEIADQLQKDHIIKSAQALEIYVALHDERNSLQAGTYKLSPSLSVTNIVSKIAKGKVATNLVTILPGQTIQQIGDTFVNDGFSQASVAAALDPDQYRASYPAAADIPEGESLEGFLYPDSYQKTASTDPSTIIEEALTEMQTHLTTSLLRSFAGEGLTAYQGVTVASIVEKEVSAQSDRYQVAQVFLTRLKDNMPLGSDVTAYYGSEMAGVGQNVNFDSPYNTLLHNGLPPGPIGTISQSSLTAVAHPANTNWLYFVSGDNGTTYFSTTLAQQQQNTAQYCHQLCRSN